MHFSSLAKKTAHNITMHQILKQNISSYFFNSYWIKPISITGEINSKGAKIIYRGTYGQ